ncbi:MAG TPA: FAD binding domain-containing protein [Bryobacteraceae bacterium]|jgi:CO/xanthine dehydrogenase FAD-binding subunit|nr:FAD binding domain-containing protein [Bryobacteraceae bacterium]
MRSRVPAYELRAARDLPHALSMLGESFRPIAGGTDVMVLFEAGKLAHKQWISIRGIPELRSIEVTPRHVTMGALTTYTDVRFSATLAAEFPLMAEAAALTGGIATQNRGTIGGNIVNASPAADTPPALLVYDAEIELVSPRGSRWVAYTQFHKGYKVMDLAGDELLTRIRLPRRFAGWKHFYRKVGTRRAQAISKICFAGLRRGDEVRIGLGSVGPVPLFLQGTDLSAISPIDDVRSTARYRMQVAKNLMEAFLHVTA